VERNGNRNIVVVNLNNNFTSPVYRSELSKLRNGTASRMSARVIGKGLTSSFVGGLAMDGYYGLKQHGYDRTKRLISR
jgi:hypothetical protein